MPQKKTILRLPLKQDLAFHNWQPLLKQFIENHLPIFWIPKSMPEQLLEEAAQDLGIGKDSLFLREESDLLAYGEACFIDFMPIEENTFPKTFSGKKIAAVGGVHRRDLIDQVKQCRLQKADAILSEVLPDELPIKTTPIDLDYFSQRFVFLPTVFEDDKKLQARNGTGIAVVIDSAEKTPQLPVSDREHAASSYIDEPIDCSVITPALSKHFKVTTFDVSNLNAKDRHAWLEEVSAHKAILNATQFVTTQATVAKMGDWLKMPVLNWHESNLSPLRSFLGLSQEEPLEMQVFATNKSLRQKVDAIVNLLKEEENKAQSLDEIKKYTIEEGLKVVDSVLSEEKSKFKDNIRNTYKSSPLSLNPLNPEADPALKQYYFPYIPKNVWFSKPQSVKVINQALQEKNEMRRRRWMINVAAHLFSWPYQENWMRIFKYYLLQDGEWIDHCYEGIQTLYLQDNKTTDLLGLLGQAIIHCLAIEEEIEEPYSSSMGKRLEALAKALKYFDEDAAINRNSDKTPYRYFFHKASVYAILEAFDKVDALIDAAYEANPDINDTFSSIGVICARNNKKDAAIRFMKKDFDLGRLSEDHAMACIKKLGELQEEGLAKAIIEHFYQKDKSFRGGYSTWVFHYLRQEVHDFFCKEKWPNLAQKVSPYIKWVEVDIEKKREAHWTQRFLIQLHWVCSPWEVTQSKVKAVVDGQNVSIQDRVFTAYFMWGMDADSPFDLLIKDVDVKVLEEDDNFPQAFFVYAFLKAMQGQVEGSSEVLSRFIEKNPIYFTLQTPVVKEMNHWLLLAILYRVSDEESKAQKAFNLAKELEPDFPYKEYLFKRGLASTKPAQAMKIPPVKLFSTH